MKKAVSILITLVILACATVSLADGCWYHNGKWYSVDRSGRCTEIPQQPMSWKTNLTNYNFPISSVRDVSGLCDQYCGTPVGCLGLVSNKGSNLRSEPCIDGYGVVKHGQREIEHATIIRKLHENTTVYVYFSFYDSNGNEWYYVSCSDGVTGMLYASRIMLVP